MIKNEIEYMHAKIDGIESEEELLKKIKENRQDYKYEKTFATGKMN